MRESPGQGSAASWKAGSCRAGGRGARRLRSRASAPGGAAGWEGTSRRARWSLERYDDGAERRDAPPHPKVSHENESLTLLPRVLLLTGAFNPQQGQPDIVGSRLGTLVVNENVSLRIGLHVQMDSGSLVATFASVDQGAYGIEVAGLLVAGNSVRFEVPSAGIRYTGSFSGPDGRFRIGQHQRFPRRRRGRRGLPQGRGARPSGHGWGDPASASGSRRGFHSATCRGLPAFAVGAALDPATGETAGELRQVRLFRESTAGFNPRPPRWPLVPDPSQAAA